MINETFKCLTVQQPWANLIIERGKDIENRSWKTKYRGKLYIHSSKSIHIQYKTSTYPLKYGVVDLFPRGAIIGHVDLVDIVTQSNSKWFDGMSKYGWVLENPVKLETPIYCPGQLRIWNYEHVEAK